MNRETTEPTLDEHGYEIHPAWALIGASRGSCSPGVHLFDSDITHQHTVRIRLHMAVRKRNLMNDHLHDRGTLFEVELSEAQWASFVSTTNSGSGVPCTLRLTPDGYTPDFPHSPKLAKTIAESHQAAQAAFDDIKEAFAEVEKLLSGGTAKQKREALNTLRARINNAVPNVDFAGKQLVGQAEDVVQKAKADVEAFVAARALQLGLNSGDFSSMPMIAPGKEDIS